MTFFWLVLPSLFAPLFGLFVDRVRRRPLLVWANVASAACVLPLLLVRDAGDVWLIYAVAFVYGISFVVVPAGLNGLLKEVMPPRLLVEANASLQTIKESFRLVGPLAGAALFSALGGGAVAVVDAASFLVAAAVIGSMRVHEDQPVRSAQHWRLELTEGIRHIWYDVLLRHTLVALGVTVLVVGFSESAIFAVTDAFGRPVEFIGVLLTVQGVGAIAGGLTASRLVRRCGEAGTLAVSLGVLAVGAGLMALAPSLWVVFLAVVTFGYALPPMMIAFGTLMQLRTPGRLMGRVSTANDVVLGTPQTVSIAVGALLVSLLDYRLIFAIMAAVTAAAAAYLAIALRSSLFASHTGESSATAGSPAQVTTVAPVSGLE
jgi:MFS family permease